MQTSIANVIENAMSYVGIGILIFGFVVAIIQIIRVSISKDDKETIKSN